MVYNLKYLSCNVETKTTLDFIHSVLLGFTHVIRLALGGQAKSEHGYRIELITDHSH